MKGGFADRITPPEGEGTHGAESGGGLCAIVYQGNEPFSCLRLRQEADVPGIGREARTRWTPSEGK